MGLLIDGYNLLHESGLLGRGRGPQQLERARSALLRFLENSLDEAERAATIVVFDAKNAPHGVPRASRHAGIEVLFAAEHAEADDLLEELIRADSAPRQLTVVSSDHRLQRAARRRKAKAVDSDRWYARRVRERNLPQSRSTNRAKESTSAKPEMPLSQAEISECLRQFSSPPAETQQPEKPVARPWQNDAESNDPDNPFPPGYGEDLLED